MIADILSKDDLQAIAIGKWACVETGEVATVTAYFVDHETNNMEIIYHYDDRVECRSDWFDFQNDFVKL